ncbi:1-phosphofructokinase [Proteinivorax tanatarense]|uniref:Tagatose-6-phosphate kinase n=1 Tax=Proteinivorax tanatarense TaxID=1260629 RepID=A0AAU7VN45_9FIRM
MITTVTLNPAIDRMYYIDSLESNDVVRCNNYNINAGGKGLNVTKVLVKLQAEVQCFGFIGGSAGNFVTKELEKLGAVNKFTKIDRETRTCLSIMDTTGKQFELVESGPQIKADEIERFILTFNDINESKTLVMSGSLPKGLEDNFYRTLISKANQKGVKVVLDTSGNPLKEGIKENPFLIKPNIEELRKLLNRDFNTEDDLLKGTLDCLKLGAQNVALSLGGDGMIFSNQDASYRVKVSKVKVVSPVGSGDSTVAGLAYGINNELGIRETLALANACGASNATMAGIGQINFKQVQDLKEKIEVSKVRG